VSLKFIKTLTTGDADYDPYVNVPFGLAHHGDRLFVAFARRRPGIPAALSVVDLTNSSAPHINPPLVAYPSLAMNSLNVNILIRKKQRLNVDNTFYSNFTIL
jgi:hypothetical protein